ncbi:hypothetical protein BDZ45DRAFT_741227 [Acephala macrosclerotiorum]|nr:hypothetical protein BDZ45DRAFT_741227 [Acephala macrosclerotiorum]
MTLQDFQLLLAMVVAYITSSEAAPTTLPWDTPSSKNTIIGRETIPTIDVGDWALHRGWHSNRGPHMLLVYLAGHGGGTVLLCWMAFRVWLSMFLNVWGIEGRCVQVRGSVIVSYASFGSIEGSKKKLSVFRSSLPQLALSAMHQAVKLKNLVLIALLLKTYIDLGFLTQLHQVCIMFWGSTISSQ